MVKHGSKKSENLELRISYDTKQELAERAKSEGRTVSHIVRSLIGTYLSSPAPATQTLPSGDSPMSFKNFILRKPKLVLAGLAAMAASTLLFIPSAMAVPVLLNVQGEYIEYGVEGPDSVRTRRFETDIELEFGSTIIMAIDGQTVSDNLVLTQDGMWIKVEVDETDIIGGEKAVSILLSIIEKNNETETILANPTLTAAYDETAAFMSETEDKKYSFKFLPRNKF